MICDIARQTGLPIAVNLALKYTLDRKTKQIAYRTDWGHSAADLLDVLASGANTPKATTSSTTSTSSWGQLRCRNPAQRAHRYAIRPPRRRAV